MLPAVALFFFLVDVQLNYEKKKNEPNERKEKKGRGADEKSVFQISFAFEWAVCEVRDVSKESPPSAQ